MANNVKELLLALWHAANVKHSSILLFFRCRIAHRQRQPWSDPRPTKQHLCALRLCGCRGSGPKHGDLVFLLWRLVRVIKHRASRDALGIEAQTRRSMAC